MGQLPQSGANFTGVKPYDSQGSGRTVLASAEHQHMLGGFKSMSTEASSQGYHALAITNAINSLRGNASPVNSFSKDGSPTRRCIVFSGFEVEYELNNFHGGPQTDVQIIDIRVTSKRVKEERKSALWDVSFNDSEIDSAWELTSQTPNPLLQASGKVSGKTGQEIKVGINGYCDNLHHALAMLPAHISRGEQISLGKLKQTGYQLFYVPQEGSAVKSGWSFMRDIGRKDVNPQIKESARILANHMKEAHDNGLHVEWTSHRGGSKVLTEAMKLLARRKINVAGKQTIFLSDHTSSHYEADTARRAIGMDTRASKWHNSNKGVAQLIGGQRFGAADIACSINELVNHTPENERVGKIIDTVSGAHGVYKSAASQGGTIAGLASAFGMSSAFGYALVKALGFTAVSSVPSLNEGYHKGQLDQVKNLTNKVLSKQGNGF